MAILGTLEKTASPSRKVAVERTKRAVLFDPSNTAATLLVSTQQGCGETLPDLLTSQLLWSKRVFL